MKKLIGTKEKLNRDAGDTAQSIHVKRFHPVPALVSPPKSEVILRPYVEKPD